MLLGDFSSVESEDILHKSKSFFLITVLFDLM